MTPILSRSGEPVLREAARHRALLAFDFDGTLAPIVADRRMAALAPSTRALLRMAGILYPCAVVSGRDRDDVLPRVARVPLLAVVGNHGAEWGEGGPDPRARRQVRAWAAALRGTLGGVGGVDVEEKAVTVAVHFRHAPPGGELRRRLADAAVALPGARVFGGHEVLNLAPIDLPTKGDAIEELARRAGASWVVYVGDDLTDEDAFRSRAVTVGVRVGASPASAAAWYLAAQRDVDDLLRALVVARLVAGGVGEEGRKLWDLGGGE